ncbi:hypothetical protein ACLMAL_14990 [Nocardia sp. CWNU-33]|uniref:hypothetical protein n=1 Tax=Nocardia sp. CWNU-33 TaxID=3392117 RepID=UPI00398F4680
MLRTSGSSDNPTVEFRTLPVLHYDVRAAFGAHIPTTRSSTPSTKPADQATDTASTTGSVTATPDVGTPSTAPSPAMLSPASTDRSAMANVRWAERSCANRLRHGQTDSTDGALVLDHASTVDVVRFHPGGFLC